ncbi:hypothetical protein [Streptomyces sp. 8P21H-1]|uniref:hypothetical protein n=1 Tax=Streptomyces sp. 8P21H-1 TaxID=2737048 RepID=UPI00156FE2F3|nr:hypothetical protein [Streptomyces sp. 8P21H-1]NSL43624.1 hypothetical protein [Streptomyces sp. 8P21H-1]
MSTVNPAGNAGHHTSDGTATHPSRRLSTETKAAFKTTEFFVYLASVIAVLIASMVVGDDEGHADYFRADKAWLYIIILSVGYMISRGLAKSGSRDPYDESR